MGFNGREFVQSVSAATITLLFDDDTMRQVSGQVTLQRFDETARFRIVYEGEAASGMDVTDSVELPTDVEWQIVAKLLVTQHGGGRNNFMVQLMFPDTRERRGPYIVQLLMPVVPGNSRRSKMFHEAIVFADQTVRTAHPR
jgi:hypothetical protein